MLEIPLQGIIPTFTAGGVSLVAIWNNGLLLTCFLDYLSITVLQE